MASGFVALELLGVLLLLLLQHLFAGVRQERTSDGTSRSSQEAMISLVAQKRSSRPPYQGRT